MRKIIVLDGANGTGTSTQCNILEKKLNCILTRHPGSTDLGKELRKIVKFSNFDMSPKQELLLFATDAMSFYQKYIEDKNDNKIVLCDRFNLVSALAYQIAGGAKIEHIECIFNTMKGLGFNTKIDKLFIFLAPYDVLVDRLDKPNLIDQDKNEGNKKDRFESSGDDFMMKVCTNYYKIANGKYGELLIKNNLVNDIISIDARLDIDEINNEILKTI